MKIIAGGANRPLAEAIAKNLGLNLTDCLIRHFPDTEICIEILENIRGEDVFIIQPTSNPGNSNIMELLLMIDAARRGSASKIAAVIPYFGYARQDRKTGPRSPISAKLVANMIETAGADRVLTLDLHAAQIQGFFDIPTDNLFAVPVLSDDALKRKLDSVMVVSPDVGGVIRARAFAKKLKADLAIIDKRRNEGSTSQVMNVIGDVKNRSCILIDDIVDSAGTLCNAAEVLMEHGASKVCAYATHGVFTGESLKRINSSSFFSFTITDSILNEKASLETSKIKIISIASLLAEAIKRIANNQSVSDLFN